jgi:hypothetical protein
MTKLRRFVIDALALTTNLCRFVIDPLALMTNRRRFVNDPVGLNTKAENTGMERQARYPFFLFSSSLERVKPPLGVM